MELNMIASGGPAQPTEDELRALAGLILHAHVAGRRLPEHAAGLPDRMLVDRLARDDAKQVLAILKELYGIEWWTREEFVRAFIGGALQGWRPGMLVQSRQDRLRLVSTTCPIAAEVERDPRTCEACQALQRHAAYIALIGQIEEVRFVRVMSRGESACEAHVRFRPHRKEATAAPPSSPPRTSGGDVVANV